MRLWEMFCAFFSLKVPVENVSPFFVQNKNRDETGAQICKGIKKQNKKKQKGLNRYILKRDAAVSDFT